MLQPIIVATTASLSRVCDSNEATEVHSCVHGVLTLMETYLETWMRWRVNDERASKNSIIGSTVVCGKGEGVYPRGIQPWQI